MAVAVTDHVENRPKDGVRRGMERPVRRHLGHQVGDGLPMTGWKSEEMKLRSLWICFEGGAYKVRFC